MQNGKLQLYDECWWSGAGIKLFKISAYKLVKAMNKELAAQGYITMVGRIPKAFWAKKMYGYEIAGN